MQAAARDARKEKGTVVRVGEIERRSKGLQCKRLVSEAELLREERRQRRRAVAHCGGSARAVESKRNEIARAQHVEIEIHLREQITKERKTAALGAPNLDILLFFRRKRLHIRS